MIAESPRDEIKLVAEGHDMIRRDMQTVHENFTYRGLGAVYKRADGKPRLRIRGDYVRRTAEEHNLPTGGAMVKS